MKNMGILGLQSAQSFSHRLFNSFDIDNDNKVKIIPIIDIIPGLCRVYGCVKDRKLKAKGKNII